jgi:hypothetical protein
VLVAQGSLAEALKAFQDGVAIIERLAKTDPGNGLWQAGLVAAYQKIGDVLLAQGICRNAIAD